MKPNPILLAADGSEHSDRATTWCAQYAATTGLPVVAVHAVEINFYPVGFGSPAPNLPPRVTTEQLDELRDLITRDWCKPLADAGVDFRVVMPEGRAATVIEENARLLNASIVVCGRRGRGGIAEFFLGSTSHELTHRLPIPLVIVP